MSMDVSRLQVSLEEGERWRRTLSITVPSDIVEEERREAVRKLAHKVPMRGFRPGKVPMREVEKRYGPALNQEVVDRVVGEAYREVLRERKLRPISEGEVSKVDFDGGSDLSFEVSFDVAPRIELARTGGFQVAKTVANVGGDEVDKVIEQLREQHGSWVPAEAGTPVDGDRVSVRLQRVAEEGDEPRPYEFVLGKDEAIPDVEAAIRSLEVGGDGEFAVTFPDDFSNEERRGVSETLQIFLDARKMLELPEIDDAFAARVGDFQSMDDLRARILEDLEKEAGNEAESRVRGELMAQLIAANPFDVPQSMVDDYLRSILSGGKDANDERLAEQMELLRPQLAPRAEEEVKGFLIMERYIEDRGLRASEDEVDQEIETMAERVGTTPGELYASLQKAKRIERLEREITERKFFEALKAESTITEAA